MSDALGSLVERAMVERNVPIPAIAVVHDDAPVLLKAFGQRDVEAGLPVTPDMQFALYPGSLHGSLSMRSMSEAGTAACC